MKIKISSLLILIFSLAIFYSCGKKDDTKTSDNKTDSKTTSKDEGISANKPFHVVFEMQHMDKKEVQGTIDAYYYGNKCRSQSNMNISGQAMTGTAYYTGGDTVYMITQVGGIKTGMKFSKNEFGKKEDQVDVATFKDKLKTMDKIGEEEILGKKCDIYKDKEGKYTISVYKETIPLKFGTADGKTVIVATKYETDVKVTDDMFIPPSDVKYMDASNMMKNMKDVKPKDMENMKDKMKDMEEQMKKYKK